MYAEQHCTKDDDAFMLQTTLQSIFHPFFVFFVQIDGAGVLNFVRFGVLKAQDGLLDPLGFISIDIMISKPRKWRK